MGNNSDLAVRLRMDIKDFETKIQTSMRKMKNLSKDFVKAGRNLSVGLTAPIVGLGVASLAAFDKQEKALAQVRTGLESTKGAAKLTFDQLEKAASDLQSNTLFGDEVILKDATAQLLTFTNIAGDQFLQAQEAALNLATRLDGDLKSASIQLGKALNDPVANLSALSRSGIQFSKDQKATIKSLVETNRLAEAQTIILGELENQYGGAAAAAAEAGLGPFTQFTNILGDALEVIGQTIAETIDLASVMKTLSGFVSRAVEWFKQLSPTVKRVILIVGGLLAAIGPLSLAIGGIISLIPMLVSGLSALGTAFTFMLGPIGLIITALGLLTAAAIYFWDDIREPVETGINFLIKGLNTYIEMYQWAVDKMLGLAIKAGDALFIDTSGLKKARKEINDFVDSIKIDEIKLPEAEEKKKEKKKEEEVKKKKKTTPDAEPVVKPLALVSPKDEAKAAVEKKKAKEKEAAEEIARLKALEAKKLAVTEEAYGVSSEKLTNKLLNDQITQEEHDIQQGEAKIAYFENLMLLEEDGSLAMLELQNEVLKEKKALDEEEAASNQAMSDQKIRNASAIANGMSSTMDIMKTLGIKSKAFAMLQIGLETGMAMARGIAEASKIGYPQNIPAIVSIIGVVAAGAAQAKQVAQGSFANGGMVFGPTMALVGEGSGTNSQNPEVIAPLDKLKSYIGQGSSSGAMELMGSVEMLMRGTELVGVLDRTNVKIANIS